MNIDGIPINCIADATKYFELLDANKKKVTLTIGILEKQAMHEDDDLPFMYFDQLSTISNHLKNNSIHPDNATV